MIGPPPAAACPIAGALTDLFLVLLAAKLGDELFKRIRQPAIVGEILAGVIVGPSVLGLLEPTEVLEVFAELGVVFCFSGWASRPASRTCARWAGRRA